MFCCCSSLHSPPPSLPPPHTSWLLVPFRLTLHCVSDTISMSNSLAMQSRRKDSASARKKVVKGKMKHRKSNTLTVIITVFKLHKDHHAQREQEKRSFLSLAAFPALFCSPASSLEGKAGRLWGENCHARFAQLPPFWQCAERKKGRRWDTSHCVLR